MKISLRHILVLIIFLTGSLFAQYENKNADSESKIQNLLKYANPICGTDGFGNTYPGVSAPFGMIQWSPDSGPTGVGVRKGGYKYKDTTIWGFGLDHMSGAGCTYGGNFSFMPVLTEVNSSPDNNVAFASEFSHDNEKASPGYYSVKMDNGINVELTSTVRSGFGKFSFPENVSPAMIVNSASNANGIDHSSININPEENSLSGSMTGGHFCRTSSITTIYFYAVFNRPFQSYAVWNDSLFEQNKMKAAGKASGAYLTFDKSGGSNVLAKVAISYVSIENAKLNLENENPVSEFSPDDFNSAVHSIGDTWNKWLNKIHITGGTEDQLQTFYSMFYHTLLGPTVCSDVNGEYMGYDGIVHTVERGRRHYANISGWDIYRTECQFLAMMAPNVASDVAQSLLIDYKQGGTFPRWGVPNIDSGVMMGDPAAPIIAGFYNFGATDFDAEEAFAGLFKAATDPSVYAPRSNTYERDALEDYLTLGYVPQNQKGGYGNVSMTLEYASADFALAQFAKSLGHEKEYRILMSHAQNWRNHFNPETGYLQMKRRDSSWTPGFAPDLPVYDGNRGYVEGTAGQYVWMVPFNYKELIEKMGGAEIAEKRLDNFFSKLNDGDKSQYANLGNEPCIETPWIYYFMGKPYKSQELVRRVMKKLYSPGPLAYPGNDDLGTMSAWYIFSALGIYPELPGSDILLLSAPLFPKVEMHLQNGDVTIIGKGAGENSPYVKEVRVNGNSYKKTWIRFDDIEQGGIIEFEVSSKPNMEFGAKAENYPPSFSEDD